MFCAAVRRISWLPPTSSFYLFFETESWKNKQTKRNEAKLLATSDLSNTSSSQEVEHVEECPWSFHNNLDSLTALSLSYRFSYLEEITAVAQISKVSLIRWERFRGSQIVFSQLFLPVQTLPKPKQQQQKQKVTAFTQLLGWIDRRSLCCFISSVP